MSLICYIKYVNMAFILFEYSSIKEEYWIFEQMLLNSIAFS